MFPSLDLGVLKVLFLEADQYPAQAAAGVFRVEGAGLLMLCNLVAVHGVADEAVVFCEFPDHRGPGLRG